VIVKLAKFGCWLGAGGIGLAVAAVSNDSMPAARVALVVILVSAAVLLMVMAVIKVQEWVAR
jgi:hypothetical protein